MLHRADKTADGVTASLLRDEIAALEALTKTAGDDDGSIDRRISLARGRWPDDLRLRLIEGGWLEKTGRVEEAVAAFQTARDDHPANPGLWCDWSNSSYAVKGLTMPASCFVRPRGQVARQNRREPGCCLAS